MVIDFGIMQGLLAKPSLVEERRRLRYNRGMKFPKIENQQEIS